MPEIIAAVTTIAISSANFGTTLGALVQVGLIIGANYAISQAFAKPKENITTELITGIKANTDGSITPHKIIYGKRRVGGAVVFRNLTDEGFYPNTDTPESSKPNENLYYHTAIALAGHEIDSIENIFFFDQELTIENYPNRTNLYVVTDEKYNQLDIEGGISKYAYIEAFNYSEDDQYVNSVTCYKLLPDTTNLLEIGDTFTLTGITEWSNETGSNHAELQVFTLTSNVTTNSKGVATLEFTPDLRLDGITNSVGGRLDTYKVTARNIITDKVISRNSNVLLMYKYGDNPQFDNSNTEDQIELDLLAKAGYKEYFRYETQTGSTHPIRARIIADGNFGNGQSFMNGVAFIYARLRYHPAAFSSIPNINAVVKGKKCYDPRTGSTVYTNNPALILRDYLVSGYGCNISSSDIDDTYTIAAANICDESVTIAGGTQNRYECDVLLSTEDELLDNINKILFSMLGTLVHVDDKFRMFAGAYSTPTITIDDNWLIDSVTLTPKLSIQENFNSVKGVYIDATNNYSPTNIPIITNSSYLTEDNNVSVSKDIDLSTQTDVTRAQRLAQTFLNLNRNSEVITVTCKTRAVELTPHDMVYLDLPRFSYSNRPYRVIDINRNEEGNYSIVLKYETSSVYSWNSTDASVPSIGSDLDLPSKTQVWPPSDVIVDEEKYITNNGAGVKSRAIVSFEPSPSGFARTYQLEYKLVTDAEWIILGRTQSNSFTINDIAAGIYLFRIKTINELGSFSEYVTVSKELIGLTDIPEDIQNFSLTTVNNNAYLSWDLPSEIDVQVGGSVVIKHNKNTTGATWANSNQLLPELSGKTTQTIAPLLSGTYLIKSKDSVGNVSENATTIVTNVPNLLKLNSVATLTESPNFTGSKTNMVVSGTDLTFDGVALFDSISGNFDDALGSFDSGNRIGYQTTGEYEFSTYIDLGQVFTSRVNITLDFTVDNIANFFDDYSGNFDNSLGKFDGSDNDPIKVIPYIATTDDDPSGSPVWSDWKRFYVSDITARAFKFKIAVSSTASNFNILIDELSAEVDMPDIVDSGNLTTGTGGSTSVTFNKSYKTVPKVAATIQDGDAGDYLLINNITSSGFDIGVLNSGANVSQDVSWVATGY